MNNKICVIGNDLRIKYLKSMLNVQNNISYKEASVIVAPIPFTRDDVYINQTDIKIEEFINDIITKNFNVMIVSGAISQDLKNTFSKYDNIKIYDVLDYEEIAILNNIPTAEGAIYEAIKNTDITICGSKCLVLGYGRIGKILSKMLSGIGANVSVEARKQSDLAYIKALGYNNIDINDLSCYLSEFDYIFNTIPTKILDKEHIDLLKKDVCIIDLASKPGLDYEYANKQNINLVVALGLPAKIAPKSAAKYIKDKIDELLKINDEL